MTKVLVTGAAGYIGLHVVEALVEMGAEVVALHRDQRPLYLPVEQIREDFTKLDAAALGKGAAPDVIVHLAWRNGFQHNATSHVDDLPQHARFVREAMAAGTRQFVGLGSMHEIGYWEGAINEATPSAPRSMYGIAKTALREIVRLELANVAGIYQWLRPYYILGDDKRNQSLFTKILAWEAEGKPSFPVNSGTNLYDFIDVRMLAKQIAAVSLQSEVTGIIECCSGEPVALRDRIEAFIEQHDLAIRPDYGAFPDRPYDSPGVWGDRSKIDRVMAQAAAR
jgi:nucleoside-diphosphate-sugar epimerase